MAAIPLVETGATVRGLYINTYPPLVGMRKVPLPGTWETRSRRSISLTDEGIPGDSHAGLTRVAGPNDPAEVFGRTVRNNRQLTIVDSQHMRDIAETLELPIERLIDVYEASIDDVMARFLAANILLAAGTEHAFEDYVTNATKIYFATVSQADRDELVTFKSGIEMEEFTTPCKKPATRMWQSLGRLGAQGSEDFASFKERFKEASATKRGWVGSVFMPGLIASGYSAHVETPNNPHRNS